MKNMKMATPAQSYSVQNSSPHGLGAEEKSAVWSTPRFSRPPRRSPSSSSIMPNIANRHLDRRRSSSFSSSPSLDAVHTHRRADSYNSKINSNNYSINSNDSSINRNNRNAADDGSDRRTDSHSLSTMSPQNKQQQHQLRRQGSQSRPPLSRSPCGGGGTPRTPQRQSQRQKQSEEEEEGGVAGMSSPPPSPSVSLDAVVATPNRPAKSLMFSSAARRRGRHSSPSPKSSTGSVTGGDKGMATPSPSAFSVLAVDNETPPSPSGSVISGFSVSGSAFGSGGGGEMQQQRQQRRPLSSTGLTLPEEIAGEKIDGGGGGGGEGGNSGSGGGGPLSPISKSAARYRRRSSVPSVPLPHSRSIREQPLGSSAAGCCTAVVTALKTPVTAATNASPDEAIDQKMGSSSSVNNEKTPLPGEIFAAAEQAEQGSAVRQKVRPLAAVTVKLATAVEGLRAGVFAEGEAGDIISAARVASSVVKDVGLLMGEGEDGGEDDVFVAPGGEEAREAAGAVLAEAGQAVKTLAQVCTGGVRQFCCSCCCFGRSLCTGRAVD